MADDDPPDFGKPYELVSAQLLTLPQLGSDGTIDWFGPPPSSRLVGGNTMSAGKRLGMASLPTAKKRRVPPPPAPAAPPAPPPAPPPPAPPISGVGVMDVGAGACNLLIDANNEPLAYFDIGFPLWFFVSSAPNTLRAGTPTYTGPILQNTAGNLEVILSHWDFDHWRLGRIAPLNGRPWTYPNQPIGPVVAAFLATVPNQTMYVGPPVTVGANYTIYQCAPPAGTPPAAIMNNTGLALGVNLRLPVADPAWHQMLMTADANFDSVPGHPLWPTLTAVTAVHHGSNAHGAAANLPTPAAPYAATGRVAYSYGIRANGAHCYGHPVAAAVVAYDNAGWIGTGPAPNAGRQSTAEGQQINGPPPAAHGNARVGTQAALAAAYAGTAFAAFPYAIT